ncbi:MAG: hypothetical protein ACOX8H_10625 [Ruminococcus sp.]|jgi:flagellar biosynthesis/type III secretory pathway M-ring protein FliF/YscJ
MQNDRFSYVLRTIAGAYLIYLSYRILESVAKGETGGHTVPVSVAAVIFIILGAVLVIFGVRGLVRMQKEGQQEAEEEDAEQTEAIEETAEEETAREEDSEPETPEDEHPEEEQSEEEQSENEQPEDTEKTE